MPGKTVIRELQHTGIIDAIGEAISIQDTNYEILYQNQNLKDMIGDYVEKYCYKTYQGKDLVCEECCLAMCFKDGRVHKFDQTRTTDKGVVFYEITGSPLRDSTGDIVAGIEIIRDITEKRKLQDLIASAKKDWEETFDIINEAITIHDKDFNIIRANKASVKLLGSSYKKILSQKCHESYHRSDLPPETCPSCQTLKTGIPSLIEIFEPSLNKYLEMKALPRFDKDNQIIGVIHCVRDITNRKKLEEKLHSLSLTDELTGLYNRRGFITLANQQLKIANRSKSGVLILYADLDNMKYINDTFGHREGDTALIETGNILKEVFRQSDIIARIGGDEFVVFPIEIVDTSTEALSARCQEYMNNYNVKRKRDYKLSISTGIVHHKYECPYTIEELISQADKAMYAQKKHKQ
jgi:diguanylate cyclase (GGDEF)-like protein/PAS domain S-box-containing protein